MSSRGCLRGGRRPPRPEGKRRSGRSRSRAPTARSRPGTGTAAGVATAPGGAAESRSRPCGSCARPRGKSGGSRGAAGKYGRRCRPGCASRAGREGRRTAAAAAVAAVSRRRRVLTRGRRATGGRKHSTSQKKRKNGATEFFQQQILWPCVLGPVRGCELRARLQQCYLLGDETNFAGPVRLAARGVLVPRASAGRPHAHAPRRRQQWRSGNRIAGSRSRVAVREADPAARLPSAGRRRGAGFHNFLLRACAHADSGAAREVGEGAGVLADGRACGRLQRDVVRSAPGPRAARRKSPRPHRRPLPLQIRHGFHGGGRDRREGYHHRLRAGLPPPRAGPLSRSLRPRATPPTPPRPSRVQGTIRCVIDPKSLMFLYGLQLDYSDELIGGGFSFANPNAEETCGCGKSFGV